MFAVIDLAYVAGGLALGIYFKDKFVGAWQHLVAWWKGAESYAAALEAKAKALLTKAQAVKTAATTAVKS